MKTIIFVTILIGLAFLEFAMGVAKIQAQSSNNWSEPVNLSQSGSASEPVFVFDSDGIFHTVWSDEFAGSKYVSGDGAEWSQPVVKALPFKDAVPELLADNEGFIHAFWLDSSNTLIYSAVRAADFATEISWTPPVQLTESAFDFNITLDQKGNIHLIFLRPLDSTEFPAGIYYRTLVKEAAGWVWSSPALLYSSPYFRSLEIEDSSVDIATSIIADAVQVYAVWDNRPRERVYLVISTDGGQTWGSPDEIDKPASGLGYSSTGKILVEAYDQDVILVWQRNSTGGVCSQYYQESHDGGDTWSLPNEVSSSSQNCGQESQLLSDGNGLIYLWTIPLNQVNLIAWDGQQWSNPQAQNELSSFIDPETNKTVVYDCRQPVLAGSQRLATVGCDSSGGGDIWFTYRELSDVDNWFSTQSAWSETEEFVSSQTEIDSPVLIAAPDSNLFAIWSQADLASGNVDQAAIHFARWDGESWSLSGPIIRSSQGSLTQPSAAIDGNGRIIAVWNASNDGKVYFSWANVANAQNPDEWSDAVPLPISQTLAHAPQILVGKSGTIYVIYTVPANEERGIYLTRSEDDGTSWSSPVKIFDGVAANWQLVDHPQLVETPDGGLHTLWSQRSILDSGVSLGLYYARSDDDGITWSEPEAVTDQDVMWSQIATLDQGSLVRVWQEGNQLRPVINYQFTQDGGVSWSSKESLGSFGEKSLMAKLITDPAGSLHMLQLVQASSGDLLQRHWIWDDGRWSVEEYVNLASGLLGEGVSVESAISSDGILAMILLAQTMTQPGTPDRYGLYFLNRALDLPAIQLGQPTAPPSDSPIPSSTNTPVITPTNTPLLQATPTSELSTNSFSTPPASSNNSFLSAGRGVLLAALIIIATVIFGIWRVRSNR